MNKRIYILSGPVRSGKTSGLLQWTSTRNDTGGILSPDINGKRLFMDIESKVTFNMEAGDDETETLPVGRFRFSKKGFERAIAVLQHGTNEFGWLVIDEIGPLELKGLGFCDTLKSILSNPSQKLILVVREQLAEEVVRYFNLKNNEISIISKEQLISIQ